MQFGQLKRREFITLLGGAAAAWPLAAGAQQPAKLPTIGYLCGSTQAAESQRVAALVQRLRELGWIEGRNIAIEYRWAEGRTERAAEIADEFVRLKVDLIFAAATEPALAAKKATALIPIVFPVAADPVGTGIVASLARPGGNVTGLSTFATDLAVKRLEILRDILPGLGRLAVMANVSAPGAALQMHEFHAAARPLGLEVVPLEIRRTEDIAPALESLKGRADALYVADDPLASLNRVRINTFALVARLPTIYVQREYVEAGGLMSYGPNFLDLNRRAADYVDKVLRGTKPADLPVEQPTRFHLIINLVTARALGLSVPPTLLARADEVIE
jgi:putative tryptophan/tyrosine transport system substrate-binding protein